MSNEKSQHPIDFLLRADLIPSVWCSGCGIGIVVNTFLQTVKKMNLDPDRIRVVSSGLSCTGKIPEYLRFERLDIANKDVLLSAAALKQKNPESKIIVFLNDSDFIVSGIDGLINVCKKQVDLSVIYINNFIYHVFMEHKELKKTPFRRNNSTDDSETPFNIPHLAKRCGASYVARWTPLHCRRLSFSIQEASLEEGFSLIEVVSPCLMYYVSDGKIGKTIDRMGMFYENSVIKNDEPTENLDIKAGKHIIVGRFV